MDIKIAVMNLQSGIGVTRGYRQYLTRGLKYVIPHSGKALLDAGAFLREQSVDLALLTEVEGGSRRSRYTSQLDALSENSGMPHAHFFPTWNLGSSVNEGNGLLSRLPVSQARVHPLPSARNPRVLGEALIDINGIPVTIFVAHLALSTQPRLTQLEKIAEIVKDTRTPIILGGDFNERDRSSFKILKKAGLAHATALGYPSWRPRHALQSLFVSPHFRLRSVSVARDALFSDHLPLIIEATLKQR